MTFAQYAVIFGLLAIVHVMIIVFIVKFLVIVCPPNRVAVIAGRQRVAPDGRIVGHRILVDGRTLRIPMIERVAWLDLNPIPLEIAFTSTYPHGVLNVQVIAEIQVSHSEGLLENAAEHLLDLDVSAIGQIAENALEASIVGILLSMPHEDIENIEQYRRTFKQELIAKAECDIKHLGLELNELEILSITLKQPE